MALRTISFEVLEKICDIQKIKSRLSTTSVFPLLIIILISSFFTIIILTLFNALDSKAAIGFFGIIIGSAISSITSLLVSKESRKGQLSIAALDKRLEVHQAGYTLWRKVVRSMYDEKNRQDMILQTQHWWEDNCIYLDQKSRESFISFIASADIHNELLREPRTKETIKNIRKNWSIIMKPGKALIEGVQLSVLNEDLKLKGVDSGI
jgi:hypothetical protein